MNATTTHRVPAGSMGNSPLSTLASRTTSAVATSGNDNGSATRNYTGQWFLDRFVTDKEELIKIDLIRQVAVTLDVASLKTSLDDMVAMAKKIDIKNGVAEKIVGPIYKTAMNNRSVIQKVYGAIRFAPDELKELGYTETTGFNVASVIAGKALAAKVIKWTGEAGKTKEQKDQEAYFRLEKKALKDIQESVAKLENETFIQYQQRTLSMVAARIESLQSEEVAVTIDAEVEHVLQLGHDEARMVAEAILAKLDETETV